MKSFFLATAAALVLAAPANAALVSADHPTLGVGAITQDTSTGLEWLDLTLTHQKTIAQINPLLAAGQMYDGFRLATFSEVSALITSAGVPYATVTTYVPANAAQIAAASQLTSLLGNTLRQGFGFYDGSRGVVLDPNGVSRVVGYYNTGSQNTLFMDYFTASSYTGAGVWLVRGAAADVPEPGLIGLFGLGAAMLVAGRRRKA